MTEGRRNVFLDTRVKVISGGWEGASMSDREIYSSKTTNSVHGIIKIVVYFRNVLSRDVYTISTVASECLITRVIRCRLGKAKNCRRLSYSINIFVNRLYKYRRLFIFDILISQEVPRVHRNMKSDKLILSIVDRENIGVALSIFNLK